MPSTLYKYYINYFRPKHKLTQTSLPTNLFSTFQYFLGFFLHTHGPPKKQHETAYVLSEAYTMPKRVRSKVSQKAKKLRQTPDNNSLNVRQPIPRNCKSSPNTQRGKPYSFELNSVRSTPNNNFVGAAQVKPMDKVKETLKKKEDKDNVCDAHSSDELDVVFDLQEDKKNRIYEVINVVSDDDEPNTISYERLYADDPEKRIVSPEEIPIKAPVVSQNKPIEKISVEKLNDSEDSTDIYSSIDVLNVGELIAEVVKETKSSKIVSEKEPPPLKNGSSGSVKPALQNSTVDIRDDSDDDIVCVGVFDSKSKGDQKKLNVEEICLSSDSESECTPVVPPLKIKIPVSKTPCEKSFFSETRESIFGTSNFQYRPRSGLTFPYLYPNQKQTKNHSASDTESLSTSSTKATSSDGFSPVHTQSPKLMSADESSSSLSSDSSKRLEQFSSTSHSANSSPASSIDEDKDFSFYWKAERQSRRKLELRCEEFTEFGKAVHEGRVVVDESNTLTFKVMSYNILAQNLLEGHQYLYKDHDRRALGWERRWSLIFAEIRQEDPQILCLQEVEQSHLESHFSKLQELGYKWVYKKRTNEYQDGVAIFYKEAIFEAESHSLVEFYQPGVSVLDRDNVGVVIRLRVRKSPRSAIVIATTHLLYNPRRSDVKLAQIQLLLAEIDRLAYNKEALTYFPIIMTGDFNLQPENGVYRLVTGGELLYEGMSRKTLFTPDDHNTLPQTLLPPRLGITDRCQHVDVLEARVRGEDAVSTKLYHSETNRDPQQDFSYIEESKDDRFESGTLKHGFNFQSVYEHKRGTRKEATTHHDNWITVDYIFYSTQKAKEAEESSLQLLARLRLPTEEECEKLLRHLPNFAFGSDHLPLVGKFLLRLH